MVTIWNIQRRLSLLPPEHISSEESLEIWFQPEKFNVAVTL
jgi:hypothetical protein